MIDVVFQKQAVIGLRHSMKQCADKKLAVFPLALSIGPISENGVGPQRQEVCTKLLHWQDAGNLEECNPKELATAQKALEQLLEGAAAGQSIRVWASSNADEACGLYWLAAQLGPLGAENIQLFAVDLPEFWERPDGGVVQWNSWAEVDRPLMKQLSGQARRLPVNALRAMAAQWKQLQQENAPLRAVLNGRLVSMPENLYDPFLLRELDAMEPEFLEAELVGRVLGRYQLGVSPSWLALRVEELVHSGLLERIKEQEKNDCLRQMLRKRTAEIIRRCCPT